jgi:hypothetical protein
MHGLFKTTNPYDLKHIAEMHPTCPHCGHSNRVEPGFYFGAAYVSYILMVGLLCCLITVYYLVYGEIFEHFWRLMFMATGFALVLTPVVFRYSRVIFLYICVPFKK